MANIISSQHVRSVNKVGEFLGKAGFYIDVVNNTFKTVVNLGISNGEIAWEVRFDVEPSSSTYDLESYYSDLVFNKAQQLLVTIPVHIIGEYPLTRFYADTRLNASKKYLFNPDEKVPGWIHNKYRGKGPREGEVSPLLNVLTKSIGMGMVGEVDDTKKKPKIKKTVRKVEKPLVDPKKVKKPRCPVHDTSMEFDPARQKWKCITTGCKMTARPVKDDDDRSVQIGKGETTLRLVATRDEIRALLVSDDNIALDITDLMGGSLHAWLQAVDLEEEVRKAESVGIDPVNIPGNLTININPRVSVLGVDAFLFHISDK